MREREREQTYSQMHQFGQSFLIEDNNTEKENVLSKHYRRKLIYAKDFDMACAE